MNIVRTENYACNKTVSAGYKEWSKLYLFHDRGNNINQEQVCQHPTTQTKRGRKSQRVFYNKTTTETHVENTQQPQLWAFILNLYATARHTGRSGQTRREGGKRGLSAFRPSAVSELSELLNPPGETAPQPGAVNHLHSGQATVKLQPAVAEAPRLDPEMCRLFSSPRHQQSPSRSEPRDPAPAQPEPTFIWHCRSWLTCCSADCSSLKMGGSSVSPRQDTQVAFTGTKGKWTVKVCIC